MSGSDSPSYDITKSNKYNLRSKKKHNMDKKYSGSSSSSDDSYLDESDDDHEYSSLEFNKFLAKLFPSKFINDRIKEINNTHVNTDDDEFSTEDEEIFQDKLDKNKTKSKREFLDKLKTYNRSVNPAYKNNKKKTTKKTNTKHKRKEEKEEKNYNIIISLNPSNFNHRDYEDYYSDEEDYDEDEDDEYDEDDEDDEDDNSTTSEETHTTSSNDESEPGSGSDDIHDSSSRKTATQAISSLSKELMNNTTMLTELTQICNTYKHNTDKSSHAVDDALPDNKEHIKLVVKENTKDLEPNKPKENLTNEKILDNYIKRLEQDLKNNKKNKLLNELLDISKNKKETLLKNKKKNEEKLKRKNQDKFKKLIREKNMLNDAGYFQKLDMSKQETVLDELVRINTYTQIDKPYRLTLLESSIPLSFKAAAFKKINTLRFMEPGGGEYYKIKNWVDTFMQIPFGKYKTLPINYKDGIDKCHEYMENSIAQLDKAVYGLNDAKIQIMQMIGQWISNPSAIGSSIAIKGPMGTGKTTLVKEGISKILNRDFAFISLGGATDSSCLEGHSYTYEGSTWGKIVDILIQSKSMNPVIYFDELDKISDTPKGEEIAGILTHLTDSSQNSQFHDKYFSEIDFDLSKCLFIFSYNDESKINPILKDRMYRIQTKGYGKPQKTIIANKYLLPKIRELVNFTEEDIIIPDETLHYIINTYTDEEEGVRNLKRCLEIIYTKINLYRLMKPDTNLFEEDISIKVSFPFTVTQEIVDKLVKVNDSDNNKYKHSMYM